MTSWRNRRRWLGAWLMAAILFAQLATAAYACPGMTGAASAAVVNDFGDMGDKGDMSDMAGMPCAEAMQGGMALDPDQPGLCQQHCQFGSTQQPADPLPPLGLSVPALRPLYSLDVGSAAAAEPSAWAEHRRARERVPRPAHSTLHCCYRI